MREAPWQIYPPWLERRLSQVLRYGLFLAGCLLLSFVVHLSVNCFRPVGLILFDAGPDARPVGWPLACENQAGEITHPLYFAANVLFWMVLLAPVCYLAVRRDLRRLGRSNTEGEEP